MDTGDAANGSGHKTMKKSKSWFQRLFSRKPPRNYLPFRMEKIWSISKNESGHGRLQWPNDVQYLGEHHLVVADTDDHTIKLYNLQGHMVNQVSRRDIWPQGVSATPDGGLAVTDGEEKVVKLFTSDGHYQASWGWGWFEWPRGIVCTQSENYIVSDTWKHCVSIHTSTGRLLNTFGNIDGDNHNFKHPAYITVDGFDRILISDSQRHKVLVCDMDGRLLFTFGDCKKHGHLRHPCGISVTKKNNILVVDQENNRICAFNPDGKFMNVLADIRNGLVCPSGLAVDKLGRIAVTQVGEYSDMKLLVPKQY